MTNEAKRIVSEETWEAEGIRDLVLMGEPHVRIAACAPEALRMLLDNEWAGGGQPSGYCLDCGAPQSAQHSERCRWMALMRKAGLR